MLNMISFQLKAWYFDSAPRTIARVFISNRWSIDPCGMPSWTETKPASQTRASIMWIWTHGNGKRGWFQKYWSQALVLGETLYQVVLFPSTVLCIRLICTSRKVAQSSDVNKVLGNVHCLLQLFYRLCRIMCLFIKECRELVTITF